MYRNQFLNILFREPNFFYKILFFVSHDFTFWKYVPRKEKAEYNRGLKVEKKAQKFFL